MWRNWTGRHSCGRGAGSCSTRHWRKGCRRTCAPRGGSDFRPRRDDQLADVERRLKIPLPPSYRAFLKVSNGWGQTTFAIEHVWGTRQINWFRKKNRDWIEAYTVPSMWEPHEETPDEEYFAYEQLAAEFRSAHLKETLQISEIGDAAVYLLNPQVIDGTGEWEAWFFANWLPGVHRYRSFREMMEAEYSSFAGLEWKQPAGLTGLPEEYIGSPGSPKRRLKLRKVRKPGPPTEVLIAALEYGTAVPGPAPTAPGSAAAAMMRALNELPASSNPIQELGRRRGDPRVVDALVSLLHREQDSNVREEVAQALGRLRDPRAIDPLIEMLRDDSHASNIAIYALKAIAPERLREPLLQLLRERHFLSFACAASVLGQMGETRAIPILIDAMRDCEGNRKYDAQLAGTLLVEFGRAGSDALVEMLRNETGFVRHLAATDLLSTNSPDAADIFRDLLDDPDAAIRETAEVALKILPKRRK